MDLPAKTVFIVFGMYASFCHSQMTSSIATNIYDALELLNCTKFLTVLDRAPNATRVLYQGYFSWTIFVWNDTAFQNLPASKQNQLLNMNPQDSENYVKSFTVIKVIRTTQFSGDQPELSNSPQKTYLFLNQRVRREGNSASGIEGAMEYYADGGMVIRQNIPAGVSLIHIIDRVLDSPSDMTVAAYINPSTAPQPDTEFYNQILKYLTTGEYYPTLQVLTTANRLTFFIPTNQALSRIPPDKLQILRGNQTLLNYVIQQHIIQYRVMYTSFVYHNEGIYTFIIGTGGTAIAQRQGRITFRTSADRETVFVTGGGVTTQITKGNNTVLNGVVHFIDDLLGYVYKTAKEEIMLNSATTTFETIIDRSRYDLQQAIVATSGVTIFVPIDTAFRNLPLNTNLMSNQSLINRIIELSMVELGLAFELTSVNGEYDYRYTLRSRYFRSPINIYSQGNETWMESGYVKAKVVRPDIGVTNGYVHFIDAVPGVPSQDVPGTIFCEDWLIKPYQQLDSVGLIRYLRDPTLSKIAPCSSTNRIMNSPQQTPSSVTKLSDCGEISKLCSFTVFVPNGTAITNFLNTYYGQQIQADPQLWHWVLQRHITKGLIFINETLIAEPNSYTALNGNKVGYRRSTDRKTYLTYGGKEVSILHTDLGATNGVVHIIDQVLYVRDDVMTSDSAEISIMQVKVGLLISLSWTFIWKFCLEQR